MRLPFLLEVVESEVVEGGLSLRAWCPVKGRLSATEVRRRLVKCGYEVGDHVRLEFVNAAGLTDEERERAKAKERK
jgi:hypothetical protein